ncbi:MAG: EAL domain-containing protein [Candidatus Gastranaerophilaceae bacterium]
MLKNSLQNVNKTDSTITFFITIVFVFVILGMFTLTHIMISNIKLSEKITTEVVQQLAYNVHNKIVADIQVLEMVSSSISDNKSFNPKMLLTYLKPDAKQISFKSLAYAKKDGSAYSVTKNDAHVYQKNISKLPCFQKAKLGETCFSRVKESNEVIGFYRNTYAVPVYSKNKQVNAVLLAIARADIFKNILDVNNFGDTAFSHIVDSNGDYILRADNENIDVYQNFFDQPASYILKSKKTLKSDIKDLKTGVFWSYMNGQIWISAYTPINFSDWMAILCVPAKVMALNALEVALFTIGIMLAINCLLFLILKRIESIQRKSYNEMMKLAFVDDVTGGPNKARFILEAQKVMKNISSTEKYALILMDIAKFKVINELYGFEMANVILKDVYNIISRNLPKGTLLGRSYAATYLFIMKYDNEKDINSVIDKIHCEIEDYNEETMSVVKSATNKAVARLVPLFGVYLINDATVPIYIMCDRVGLAKRTIVDDVNRYVSYYDDNLRKKLLNEKNIEDEMHRALISGQFVMYLQPKYDMKNLVVCGSEALVRWVHPTKGFINPGEFVPLFEKNGFILNIDRFMWEQACKAIKSWIERGFDAVPISVNVSRLHLSNEFFIDDLKNLIHKYQISPSLLELELTETASFEDFDKFLEIVNALKKEGFRIAMDDFGSGYSSLNMLRQIPCDILKLDKGFINDSTTDERGKIVVKHILSMAKNLSLKTVSEGIETVAQAQFLTDAGCDIAQGFLYAKPMTIEEFEQVAFVKNSIEIEGLKIGA